MRGKALQLEDCSAAVTGVILGLSMPGPAPWYVGAIASLIAMGFGKIIFGGLGMNLFNPAMVGRAFVMIAFAGLMGASGYEVSQGGADIISQATPLTVFKQTGVSTPLLALLLGTTNGSLGETSAIACLLGGIFLCIRRTASWEIPAGVILTAGLIAFCVNLVDMSASWTAFHHLASGALLFGAFFIATDPVSSPVTPKGKWIFGIGVGAFIMLLRLFSGYPEGVMFAVLLMNGVTPLINRWTIPEPFGGIPSPAK
jgi:electron transport complex protein RnfD